MKLRFLALATFLFGLGACAATPSDDANDDADADMGALVTGGGAIDACPKQHAGKNADGDTVVFCDDTYPEAPFVRPPTDKRDGAAVLYAALAIRGEASTFVDRDGKGYVVLNADGQAIDFKTGGGGALAKQLRMPSNRYLYSIYRVEGTLTTTHDGAHGEVPAIKVTKAAPAVMLPGKVIDGAQLGAWEGSVPARVPNGSAMHQFDGAKRIPIRVVWTRVAASASNHFRKWTDGTLKDGETYDVTGVIENWDKPVKASDGKCIPALTAMGDASPFDGASSGNVSLTRIAGMHFPGDDEHVMNMPVGAKGWSPTTMGSFGRFRMSDFLSSGVARGTMVPHGMPSGAEIALAAAKGGGGDCSP